MKNQETLKIKKIVNNAINQLRLITSNHEDLIHQESDVKCYLFYFIHKALGQEELFDEYVIHTETPIGEYKKGEPKKKALCDLAIYKREAFNEDIKSSPIVAIELKTNDLPTKATKVLHSSYLKQFKKVKSDFERLLKTNIALPYVIFVDCENISFQWSKEREEYFNKTFLSKKVICKYFRCC